MSEFYNTILDAVDVDGMLRDTERLWNAERGQTFSCYHKAARLTERLMQKAGLERVERIAFPADGKATYLDRTMPLGWEVADATLKVLSSSVPFADPVVADYRRHPFHVIKGSPGTPRGGIVTRLITEEQMFAGEDARGTMVILAPETRPIPDIYRAACDFGALGIVSGWLRDSHLTPTAIHWANAFTEGPQWHSQADDRPLMGFCVSPLMAQKLREAVRAGAVQVEVRSDARRFVSTVDVVTGVIPGKSSKELWLLAHMYEPLPDDNSAGVVACIEIARIIRKLTEARRLPSRAYTLRLVFGLEDYGFRAYAHTRGGSLKGRVLGAVNMDALPLHGMPIKALMAPPAAHFFGDYALEALVREHGPLGDSAIELDDSGGYGDDLVLSDPLIGVPTVWIRGNRSMWHCSLQSMSDIRPDYFARTVAFNGAWCAEMLTLTTARAEALIQSAGAQAVRHIHEEADCVASRHAEGKALAGGLAPREALRRRLKREEERLRDFTRVYRGPLIEKTISMVRKEARRAETELLAVTPNPSARAKAPRSRCEAIASSLVPIRTMPGLPGDRCRAPKAERGPHTDVSNYQPIARVMAAMDGKANLLDLARLATWEMNEPLTDAFLRRIIGATEFLDEHGYIRLRCDRQITRRDVTRVLQRVGVERGDLLVLHSGLSSLGHVAGGTDAIIDGVLDALGPKGTLLMPAFTRSFTYFNGTCVRGKLHRPWHPAKSPIVTGRISAAFAKRADVLRSAHPTHSVAGIGPLAEALLSEHAESDPPTCRRSPFGKLMEHEGKMVWLGADVTSTTFFHFLEDEMRFPYLQPALCRVEREDGRIESVLCPRHLPGHRDFYKSPGEQGKMYRRLFELGLKMRRTPLGFATVRLVHARQMYDLGMKALHEDPALMLCDSPSCLFCSRYRKELAPSGRA